VNQFWKIDVSSLPIITYKKMNQGGKRHTRKKITFPEYFKIEPYIYEPQGLYWENFKKSWNA
jgi:hypothetical protein